MQSALTVGVLPQRTIGGNRLEAIICSAGAGEIPLQGGLAAHRTRAPQSIETGALKTKGGKR
jgi:hypothetical protein